MPFDGNGTFNRLYDWTVDRDNEIKIRADRMDDEMDGFATGLTTCLTKNGQTVPTADLPMGGFKHTNVADGTARTHYASVAQAQDGKLAWADAGGTADAITVTMTPTVTALVDGQWVFVRAAAANTSATPTLQVDATTARTIVKNANDALAAGDIAGDGHELVLRYRLSDTKWVLLNPKTNTTAVLTGNTLWDAKGDLIVGTGADTAARKAVGEDAAILVPNSDATDGLTYLRQPFASGIVGGYLAYSVAANALTVALKTTAGNDPSPTEPVYVLFRHATLTDGTYTVVKVEAALSVVVSSGSTLGTVNSTAFKVWVVAINNAGAAELAMFQSVSGTAPSLAINPLRNDMIISTTAEGGAGAADSGGVFYSTTARSNVPLRVLGYAEWGSGLATAGTWASGPTKVQSHAAGVLLPGEIIQSVKTQDGAYATGTTTVPLDNTIPQNTEGNQFMTRDVTPTSAAHVLDIFHAAHYGPSATIQYGVALFQDSVADALAAVQGFGYDTNTLSHVTIRHRKRAGSTSAQTYKIRAGLVSAGTIAFNGTVSGGALFNGVVPGTLEVTEVVT